ncbi:MAG TPA: hypothetical protein VLA72_03290 [Anaerolineales bacterium]|nr:hypothetical protein [Anaerolineales bacterium]
MQRWGVATCSQQDGSSSRHGRIAIGDPKRISQETFGETITSDVMVSF